MLIQAEVVQMLMDRMEDCADEPWDAWSGRLTGQWHFWTEMSCCSPVFTDVIFAL